MPNKGIRNAVYKRAGGKGQSSKFYNIYGKVVKPTDPNGFKGGQGWTAPKHQIGSMLSLGIMKQNRNAGGNNVCQPGPGPKNAECSPTLTADNIMTVGQTQSGPTTFVWGYDAINPLIPPTGLTPSTIQISGVPVTVRWIYYQNVVVPSPGFRVSLDLSGSGVSPAQDIFTSISIIDCDTKSVRTYFTSTATYNPVSADQTDWEWVDFTTNPLPGPSTVGKNLKIVIDGGNVRAEDYCPCSNDCKCRGPLAQCPCRKGGC